MSADATVYDSYPLQTNSEEIRLLLLQPGLWTDPITCTFQVISLNDAHEKYDALSYVWGPEGGDFEVILEGDPTPVRRNLSKALRRLRRRTQARRIWVDALCINQEDTHERGSQVALMARIYKRTSTTWIWLGDYQSVPASPRDTRTVDETDDLFWFGHELGSAGMDGGYGAFAIVWDLALGHDSHLNELPLFTTEPTPAGPRLRFAGETGLKAFQALIQVVHFEWWRRIWVVQEAVLPPLAMVLLGSIHMPWEVFALAALYLQKHLRCCQDLFGSAPELSNVFERFTVIVMEIGWTRQYRAQDRMNSSLHHLLWQYRGHHATDPRDKVYALLSFLRGGEGSRDLAPDYTLSEREVFRNAVLYDVHETGKLYILQGRREDRSPSARLPSWIYDWSAPIDTAEWLNERQRLRTCAYKASGDERAAVVCDESYRLRVSGILVDAVSAVGPAIQGNDMHSIAGGVSSWHQMVTDAAGEGRIRTEDGSWASAFWRTVTRDYTVDADMNPQRVGDFEDHLSAALAWSRDITDRSSRFWMYVRSTAVGQEFFTTDNGYMGMGNPRIGDKIFVLVGSDVPFLLRSTGLDDASYYVVGDCYVHGIMDGEALGGERLALLLH